VKFDSAARRVVGFAIGVALLIAAAWMVARHPDDLRRALDAARAAPVWAVALLLSLPIANWLLISGVFWTLTHRRAPHRVPPDEMAALIGSAFLLNYIPLRPGLFGRVALHRTLHHIPLRDSGMVLIENIICGGISIALCFAALVAMTCIESTSGVAAALAIAFLPSLIAALTLPLHARPYAVATLLRTFDLLAWSARYCAAATIAGRALSLPEAVALASVSQVAMLLPLAGNGLGLREWAVGLTAAWLPAALPAWSPGTDPMSSATGIMIDLVNRAAEMVIALPLGLACGAIVARRVARGPTSIDPFQEEPPRA